MIMVDAGERRGQGGIQRPHAPGHRALAHVADRRDRVLAATARPEPTFLAASVPLTGLGPAGRRVEVARLLDPGAASGLNLVVPGDVQPAALAAAGCELAGVDPVVDDIGAAAELVGGFGDAVLAVSGGRRRGGQHARAGGTAQPGGLGDQFPAAGPDLVVPPDAEPAA